MLTIIVAQYSVAIDTINSRDRWRSAMYQKVLVPLDDTEDSRSVVKALSGLLAEDGEVILLHVIRPGKTRSTGNFTVQGSQEEEGNRGAALVHLNRLSGELSEASIKSNCAVVVSTSVAEGIANYASRESADLIAMYTHGRTGLAKLLKGSVTGDVKRRTSVEVQAFGSAELAEIGTQ
jgi:nucleotide-binding universal stress UspA family protein